MRDHLKAAQAFRLNPASKPRTLMRIASDPLAKENALERDHLLSAVGDCWEPYLYSLRRV